MFHLRLRNMKKLLFLLSWSVFYAALVPSPVFACNYAKGRITSISPSVISFGEVLTINGSGFGTKGTYLSTAGLTIMITGMSIFLLTMEGQD